MNEYFTTANVVTAIAVSILILANCYLLISFNGNAWGGVGGLILYLLILVGAGFPLVPIFLYCFYAPDSSPLKAAKDGRGR
jgi:hypothetical protein